MAKKLGIGVIGCGNISKAYFSLAPLFRGIEMRACADINMDAAKARAKEFKLRAETVEDLLKADDIDIIVNLTIPAVHYEVSKQILDAGKHVYSEKPFVLSVKEGLDLKKRRREEGAAHRLGARHLPRRRAPAGAQPDRHRQARQDHQRHLPCDEPRHGALAPQSGLLLPAGRRAGARHRALLHHQPDPADRAGEAGRGLRRRRRPKERTISSKPRAGEKIPVNTPTTIHGAAGVRERRRGHAQHQLGRLGARPCADGALWRGGHGVSCRIRISSAATCAITEAAKPVKKLPKWKHPFGVPNQNARARA